MELISELLTSIRECTRLAALTDDPDEKLLLRAGIMPKSTLARFPGGYPKVLVKKALQQNKIFESPKYLLANPYNRTKPTATQYNRTKPLVNPHTRNQTAYRVFGRDRLALWYAAANHDLSGSRGEGFGLALLLRFWRLPAIQRAWRRYIERPNFKLPEDAK